MFSALNPKLKALPGISMKNPMSVFCTEKGRNRNRLFYYVVKIVEIRDEEGLW